MSRTRLLILPAVALLVFSSPSPVKADLLSHQISVAFDDPGGIFSAFYGDLTSHTVAAGMNWGQFANVQPNAVVDVLIRFDHFRSSVNSGLNVSKGVIPCQSRWI